jgi:PAS domain S-box-containing protein
MIIKNRYIKLILKKMKKPTKLYLMVISLAIIAAFQIFLLFFLWESKSVQGEMMKIVKKKFIQIFDDKFPNRLKDNYSNVINGMNDTNKYDAVGCYYFIDSILSNNDAKVIVNPIETDIDQKNCEDLGGCESIQKIINIVNKNPDGDFCMYKWKIAGQGVNPNVLFDKIGFVKKIPGTNWIIGVSANVPPYTNFFPLIIFFTAISFIGITLFIFLSISENNRLKKQKDKLDEKSEQLKKQKDQFERLSIVAQETDNAVTIMDSKGNLEWVNPGFEKMYGRSLEEFLEHCGGKNIRNTSVNPKIDEQLNKCFTNKVSVIYENEIITKMGETKYLTTTLTPIPSKEDTTIINKIVAINTDISDRKKVQMDLEISGKKLKEQNATKDALFGIINHDIKPFLTNYLKDPIDKIINDFGNLSEKKILEKLSVLKQTILTVNVIFGKLSQWTKPQMGEFAFKEDCFDLKEIQDELKSLIPIAYSKNLKLKFEISTGSFVRADKTMIEIILHNLIFNAIKYTKKGEVLIYTEDIDDEYIKVAVTDTGIGIKQTDIDKLFRTDIDNKNIGSPEDKGSGVGLLLCKELLKKHSEHFKANFEISVKSEYNHGSTFCVTLLKQKK